MSPLRKEVKEYIRVCEHLLSEAALSTATPFSAEECGIMEYYNSEVAKLMSSHCPSSPIVM